jgi:hypothetical protein
LERSESRRSLAAFAKRDPTAASAGGGDQSRRIALQGRTMMAMHTGSCACGQIGITAACEPQTVSMCHCLLCQKRTGSTYSVHAYFPTENVRVVGTTKVYARKGDSGAYVYFHFCPECGSTIYWEVEASPGKTGIPVGVFADPTFPPPNVSIFVPHKHPWVSVPEGIPQNEGHSATFAAAAASAVARRS